MLTLDLARLERERGPVHLHREVPPDAPLLEDTELGLAAPLVLDLTVRGLASGEIVVRGTISGALARECRRCLDPVEVSLEEEIDLLFVPEAALDPAAEEEDDEGIHRFNRASGKLELGEPIREEAILASPLYVECDPDCEGLCPKCGTNLNDDSCECTVREPDPRWDALRAMKE